MAHCLDVAHNPNTYSLAPNDRVDLLTDNQKQQTCTASQLLVLLALRQDATPRAVSDQMEAAMLALERGHADNWALKDETYRDFPRLPVASKARFLPTCNVSSSFAEVKTSQAPL